MINQTRAEKAYQKALMLDREAKELIAYANECRDEIYRLADLYIDGRILEDVGKEQNKLKREAERYKAKADKNLREVHRLRLKYNF